MSSRGANSGRTIMSPSRSISMCSPPSSMRASPGWRGAKRRPKLRRFPASPSGRSIFTSTTHAPSSARRPAPRPSSRRRPAASSSRSTSISRGRASPHEDGERQREGSDNKTKVDPGPISFGIFGKHEEVEQDPQPDGDSQGEPDEVTGGLIGGPNAFVLRRADARNHHQQRPDE